MGIHFQEIYAVELKTNVNQTLTAKRPNEGCWCVL